jgi:hypothetical protein
VLVLLLTSIFAGCAASAEFAPYRACLYDRGGRGLFCTGTVVAKGDDLRLRFRYDDASWGDHDDPKDPRHGFIWVGADDTARFVRPCAAASPFTAFDATRQAPQPNPRDQQQ